MSTVYPTSSAPTTDQDLPDPVLMKSMLEEAAQLFRTYEQSHRARGPEHAEKAERNADIASRIETLLTTPEPALADNLAHLRNKFSVFKPTLMDDWGGSYELTSHLPDGRELKYAVQVKFLGCISPPGTALKDITFRVMVKGTDDFAMVYDTSSLDMAESAFRTLIQVPYITQNFLSKNGFGVF